MKIKFFICNLLMATLVSAENIETIIRNNQKGALPAFPVANTQSFTSLQQSAADGDLTAQEKVPKLLEDHLKAVYGVLLKQKGVVFSVRRPVRGFDKPESNYAINLEEFFAGTTDNVRVKKTNFDVSGKDGATWQISVLKYKPAGSMVEVRKGNASQWVPLVDLCDTDRRFVESALADDVFESGLDISSQDSRSDGATVEKDKVSSTHYLTGEKVEGSFASASMRDISRRIVLENKGGVPLKNLIVEYQSFAEQMIMKRPKDFPTDYRCVGFFVVKSLAPGERKELELNLPEMVDAKQETINTGDYEYYRVIPSDCNQKSEGRMNGVWVKIHRFTSYGERLTREYQSAGVPSSAEWVNVVPTGADIRR